jgi:hypothetical protein
VSGTLVIAQEVEPPLGTEPGEVTIEDNYVLICDGTAYHSGVVVHLCKDGTQTHVITIKGIKP